MNREEFEQAYADKYTGGDLTPVRDNRDGEGYTDHHIDLEWHLKGIGSNVWLSRKEYLIFICLIDCIGNNVANDQICESAKIIEHKKSLDVHICKLRKKINGKFIIERIFGHGCRIFKCN